MNRNKKSKFPFELPDNPSEEELIHNWTLTYDDKKEILKCRGEDNIIRFAFQLCVLKKYGQFIDDYLLAPIKIINYLSTQLGLNPFLSLSLPDRRKTEINHRERIARHLGFKTFDHETSLILSQWVSDQTSLYIPLNDLFNKANEFLFSNKILPPITRELRHIIKSAYNSAKQKIFTEISSSLTNEQKTAIDDLLKVKKGSQRTALIELASYPPDPTVQSITDYHDKFNYLQSIGVDNIDLTGYSNSLIKQFASQIKNYGAYRLRKLPPDDRYSMVACFLVEIMKTLLDHLAEMNDKYFTGMERRAKNAFEKEFRQKRKEAKSGLDTLINLTEFILAVSEPCTTPISNIYEHISKEDLELAKDSCNKHQSFLEHGLLDRLYSRFNYMKRYLPKFFELPFQAEKGAENLLKCIEIAKGLHKGDISSVPKDAPIDFVPQDWRKYLKDKKGKIVAGVWELSLASAVKQNLRSGDLFLPGSKKHISFWNLVHDKVTWEKNRDESFKDLGFSQDFDIIEESFIDEFDKEATLFEKGLSGNDFVSITNDKLRMKRDTAYDIPTGAKKLSALIEVNIPKVRIEQLLKDVDSLCGFTKKFVTIDGHRSQSQSFLPTLYATLISHGTNLGVVSMGHSTEGITVDMLRHMTGAYIREETLRAANGELISFHNSVPITKLWGSGEVSSSDGQRYGVQRSSLIATFYPRYFGFYDRAVAIYTHVSDQYSIFCTQVISCSDREALYVLDGLLHNDTILRIKAHHTDTHGYTEQLFGLCYLLGYSFMPRISKLHKQKLYKINTEKKYLKLDSVFAGAIDIKLIKEQWDQLIRVAVSLKNRTAPANIILQRLCNASPSDRLSKALTALGRLVKTIYILRYMQDRELRHFVQKQLNKGEERHNVSKYLFFANQGEFQTGDYIEIMNKATCLSLLSNAVLVWNTVKINEIVNKLRASGQEVNDDDLKHVSPLPYRHIIPSGTYHFY